MSEELTMKDMEAEINASMVKYQEGDMVKGIIAGIENYVVYVDIGSYMQGIILPDQLSDDPAFSMMDDLKIGEEISAIVDREDDGSGNIILSLKKATEIKAWEMLKEGKEEKTVYQVKVSQSVRGGVIAYLNGVRGFIPVSRLSIKRITDEEKDSYVGKIIDVIIADADSDKRNLVLSAREPEEEKARKEHDRKIAGVSVGMVTKGVIETIMPYGCFVNIGEGLSGLVHISQISHRHLKTPSEEVKVGDEVDVKVTDVKEGKISLSMKALVDVMEKTEPEDEAETEYTSDEAASTSMASLLSGIILD
ncbi:MAG: S1 RNA-binding domain-containing protein [Lachnospiraceae bacterium]|nr:S1 RNA-binding domain-containing protein [Lachnospiraceae bacterium]